MFDNNNITTNIDIALAALRAGDLVAFPTETVYGLGADANNPIAIKRVFQVKGRPIDHPLIVHLAAADQLSAWARNIPTAAFALAEQFWPGPLTLILLKQPHVSPLITGGQDTVGVRIPAHPLTLELLRRFESGIVGPSANKYGRVSPTSAQHVADDLGNEVEVILDGGYCAVGIESTIVDLTGNDPMIMRIGAINAAQISAVLSKDVQINFGPHAIRTPGSHVSHYAPNTPVQLLNSSEFFAAINTYVEQKINFSAISLHARPQNLDQNIFWQQMSSKPDEYAHDLYAALRAHDFLQNKIILIEQPPNATNWLAVLDRLSRANTKL